MTAQNLRSRVDDLQTHCWPTNLAAVRAIMQWESERFTRNSCPSLCPVPVAEVVRRNRGTKFSDLIGVRFGRMEVVGLIAFRGKGNSLWAVKCDCGRYERRRWKTVKSAIRSDKPSACHFCYGSHS